MEVSNIQKFREVFSRQIKESKTEESVNFDAGDVARIGGDDSYVLTFLEWRKGNVDNAVKLAIEVLIWRRKNNIAGLTVEEIGDEFYQKGICFIRGKDSDGNRILTFVGNRYTKEFEAPGKKLFLYLMERLRREGSKVTFILDAGNCAMVNVDLSIIRLIVEAFMHYFPNMLNRILVVDMPGILTVIWNVVKLWFNEDMKARTGHCSRIDLLKFASIDQLTTVLGGEDAWIPKEIASDIEAEFDEDCFSDAVENIKEERKTSQ